MAHKAAMTASSTNAKGNEARDFTVFLLNFFRKASRAGGFVASDLCFSLPIFSPPTSSPFMGFTEGAIRDGFFNVSLMALVDVEEDTSFFCLPMFPSLLLAQKKNERDDVCLDVGKP